MFLTVGYLLVLWLAIQAAIYIYTFVYYALSPDYRSMRSAIGYGLSVARGSAAVLNFNFGLLFLTMCPSLLTWLSQFRRLRQFLNLNKAVKVHMFIGTSILVFTAIHCIAHWLNFIHAAEAFKVPAHTLLFLHPAGATGHAALLFLIPICLFGLPLIRRRLYDTFYWVHRLHFILVGLLMAHGAFCFIKSDSKPTCNPAGFWRTTTVPLALFILEKVWRRYKFRNPVDIVAIIQHPGNTLEVQFTHPNFQRNGKWNFRAGQYLKVLAPDISHFQWHPFSITSNPEDEIVSLHISCVGDWTKKLQELSHNAKFAGEVCSAYENVGMSVRSFLPSLYIDGPFLAPADETRHYRTLVLIACGIGATPFASVLRSFLNNAFENTGVRIHFVWINREKSNFKWFYDLLKEIEDRGLSDFVQVSLYWSVKKVTPSFCYHISHTSVKFEEDPITSLKKAKTYFGRPQWGSVFDRVEASTPLGKVGVFFCGQQAVYTNIKNEIEARNSRHTVEYECHKEIF